MTSVHLTPDELTALYQAACGYHVRLPGKKEALLSALSKLVDAATLPVLAQMVAK